MFAENANLYYEMLTSLKDISSIDPVPLERIRSFCEVLLGPSESNQLISVDLIQGTNGKTQPSSFLCVTYINRYEKLAVRLIQNPRLSDGFTPCL